MTGTGPARLPRRIEHVPATPASPAHQLEWACERPPPGTVYEVVRDEWPRPGVRVIHEIRITGGRS